jgi:hypothetical protein
LFPAWGQGKGLGLKQNGFYGSRFAAASRPLAEFERNLLFTMPLVLNHKLDYTLLADTCINCQVDVANATIALARVTSAVAAAIMVACFSGVIAVIICTTAGMVTPTATPCFSRECRTLAYA